MPNQPKTPHHAIRLDHEVWADYGEACKAKGTTRSEDLRTYIVSEVEAWKAAGPAGGEAGS